MVPQEIIQVPGAKTLGPYSQAVRANGFLFVSGQPGVDPASGGAVGDTFEVQARQAFRNLEAVSEESARKTRQTTGSFSKFGLGGDESANRAGNAPEHGHA